MTLSQKPQMAKCHFCNSSFRDGVRGRDDKHYCSHSCVREHAKQCDHSAAEVDYKNDGLMTGVCGYCGFEIRAVEIDDDYLEVTGEIVVTEWCLL